MNKTHNFLSQIEKQLGEITPGKWETGSFLGGANEVYSNGHRDIAVCHLRSADAKFIAQSPETVRKLILMLKVAMEGFDKIKRKSGMFDDDSIESAIAHGALTDLDRIAAGGEHE